MLTGFLENSVQYEPLHYEHWFHSLGRGVYQELEGQLKATILEGSLRL